MFFDLTSLGFNNPIEVKKASNPPLMNESDIKIDGIMTKPTEYGHLEYWLERCPEAWAIIIAFKTDILSDGWWFNGGRNNVKKTELFCKKNLFKLELDKSVTDWAFFGDGYLWKEDYPIVPDNLMPDEDFTLKKVAHVATPTMTIKHDKYKITEFQQIVNGVTTQRWSPDKIIHAKYLTWRGQVYGRSPLWWCLPELQMIAYIKQYAADFFKEGGYPDLMLIIENAFNNSPEVESMQQRWQKFKSPSGKHGNFFMGGAGGKVTVERLNEFNKDWEFADLYSTLVGDLAMAYNLPVERVYQVLGKKVKSGAGSSDLADSGYWRQVSHYQEQWEQILNSQLFEPYFKVEMQFNRSYLQDEIRETQNFAQKVEAINNAQNLLQGYNQKLKITALLNRLNIKEEEVEQGKLKNLMPNFDTQKPNSQVQKGQAQQAYSTQKQKEQVKP